LTRIGFIGKALNTLLAPLFALDENCGTELQCSQLKVVDFSELKL